MASFQVNIGVWDPTGGREECQLLHRDVRCKGADQNILHWKSVPTNGLRTPWYTSVSQTSR